MKPMEITWKMEIFMGISNIASGYVNSLLLKMAHWNIGFTMIYLFSMLVFHSYVGVPEGNLAKSHDKAAGVTLLRLGSKIESPKAPNQVRKSAVWSRNVQIWSLGLSSLQLVIRVCSRGSSPSGGFWEVWPRVQRRANLPWTLGVQQPTSSNKGQLGSKPPVTSLTQMVMMLTENTHIIQNI